MKWQVSVHYSIEPEWYNSHTLISLLKAAVNRRKEAWCNDTGCPAERLQICSWHQFPFSNFPAMIPKILNVIRDHFVQPSNRPVTIKVWGPGGPRRYCRWAAVITEIELEINYMHTNTYLYEYIY